MSDLIKRDEAINAICRKRKLSFRPGFNKGLNAAINAVANIQSAELNIYLDDTMLKERGIK